MQTVPQGVMPEAENPLMSLVRAFGGPWSRRGATFSGQRPLDRNLEKAN
jgi:hypothetical protein